MKNAYIYINKYNKIKNKIGEYKKDETKIIKSCYKSVQNVILYKNVNHVLCHHMVVCMQENEKKACIYKCKTV